MDATRDRPTPANPLPGITTDVRVREHEDAPLPSGLPNAIGVFDGRAFMYSDGAGDVPPAGMGGLIANDTRLLNRWELLVDGRLSRALRAQATDYYSATFFLTNQGRRGLPSSTLDLRRIRLVGRDGLRERISLRSYAADPVRVELRLRTGVDFADLLEIRANRIRDRSGMVRRDHAADGSRLSFEYRNGGFETRTQVLVDPPADRIDGDDLVWELMLRREERHWFDLQVPLELGPMDLPSVRVRPGTPLNVQDPAQQWDADRAHIRCGSPLLERVLNQSAEDLLALRVRTRIGGQEVILPAAGAPWFLTLFGRDTLITAYQTMGGNPNLARGALTSLARLQGRRCNDFTDEQPGRIPHESREGELTRLGELPYSPYYGTADATQLWLILLSEYWRWTGDDDLVRRLWDEARAALDWIDRYGDRDGDGYVEYATASPHGLGNQCWRDSWDGVQFADGRIPVLPIATCELQGYVFDAKTRLAELAAGPMADPALAARLRDQAERLFERFNRDFWIEERGGYYAIGLDGDKNRIDSLTSNIGHLLWSGIVPPERAPLLGRQLMSSAMFSGWGIRTLSTDDAGYNPIGYHTGTVWPHDTSLIVQGLTQYGLRDEANRLALALLAAADHFDQRLPEVFAGFSRDDGPFPVPYPTPCSPQAWASGAPLQLIGSILGLDARDGQLTVLPQVPAELGTIRIDRLQAFGRRWFIEATGADSRVTPLPE
ncbi:glycogen debranching N-terminal domain-containing protein [Solwaraspora sp. WMMD1047]|uniref:amylo-alpha-1,6-glucosidase n=1 Tax=Solwaraspora sp. WMMD1047 TaxID=3016102 RepID=UPI002416A7B5|nr:glycogen debranching N-terminal domain-containing protein [Solwaraspora sp. WMMD1047]MDG4831634.1 glycogen debranching N-terminal domain-containing protein [Solwaraspora sp. WMMD1047]